MLLKTASLPKTTSGKIQRHLCREHFIQGSLKVVAKCVGYSQEVEPEIPLQAWDESRPGHMRVDTAATSRLKAPQAQSRWWNLMTWGRKPHWRSTVSLSLTLQMVADLLKISFSKVDVHSPLNMLGIDSLMAVELKTTIEEDMGIEFPVEALFLGAGISDLTAHILWQRTTLEEGLKPKTDLWERCYHQAVSAESRRKGALDHREAREINRSACRLRTFPNTGTFSGSSWE